MAGSLFLGRSSSGAHHSGTILKKWLNCREFWRERRGLRRARIFTSAGFGGGETRRRACRNCGTLDYGALGAGLASRAWIGPALLDAAVRFRDVTLGYDR